MLVLEKVEVEKWRWKGVVLLCDELPGSMGLISVFILLASGNLNTKFKILNSFSGVG